MKKILTTIALAVLITFANVPSANAAVIASRSLAVNTDKINGQAKVLTNRKNLLLNYLEKEKNHLDQLKTRINAAKNLTAEAKSLITKLIDQNISNLEGQKESVQSAKSTSELKNIAGSLKEQVGQFKSDIRTQIHKSMKIRYQNIIENLQKHQDSVQKHLTSLRQKGQNISSAENLLDQSKSETSLAQTSFNQSAPNISDANFVAFQNHLKTAVSLLKQAVNLLKSVK